MTSPLPVETLEYQGLSIEIYDLPKTNDPDPAKAAYTQTFILDVIRGIGMIDERWIHCLKQLGVVIRITSSPLTHYPQTDSGLWNKTGYTDTSKIPKASYVFDKSLQSNGSTLPFSDKSYRQFTILHELGHQLEIMLADAFLPGSNFGGADVIPGFSNIIKSEFQTILEKIGKSDPAIMPYANQLQGFIGDQGTNKIREMFAHLFAIHESDGTVSGDYKIEETLQLRVLKQYFPKTIEYVRQLEELAMYICEQKPSKQTKLYKKLADPKFWPILPQGGLDFTELKRKLLGVQIVDLEDGKPNHFNEDGTPKGSTAKEIAQALKGEWIAEFVGICLLLGSEGQSFDQFKSQHIANLLNRLNLVKLIEKLLPNKPVEDLVPALVRLMLDPTAGQQVYTTIPGSDSLSLVLGFYGFDMDTPLVLSGAREARALKPITEILDAAKIFAGIGNKINALIDSNAELAATISAKVSAPLASFTNLFQQDWLPNGFSKRLLKFKHLIDRGLAVLAGALLSEDELNAIQTAFPEELLEKIVALRNAPETYVKGDPLERAVLNQIWGLVNGTLGGWDQGNLITAYKAQLVLDAERLAPPPPPLPPEEGLSAAEQWLRAALGTEAPSTGGPSITDGLKKIPWYVGLGGFVKGFLGGLAGGLFGPLVLDLDGDGIKTTPVQDGTLFDLDSNGTSELTAWVGSADGLLVLDRNGDGLITDATDLFGDHTLLSNGNIAEHGFTALSQLDSNSDGKIDQNDTLFDELRVLTGAGTLHSLDELGIESLSLTYSETDETDANGNVTLKRGTFKKADGSIQELSDVALQAFLPATEGDDTIPTPTGIDDLPNVKGAGFVTDLHQAMIADESGTLQDLVESFTLETDISDRNTILHDIIETWTRVSEVEVDTIPVGADADHFKVLTRFLGTTSLAIDANLVELAYFYLSESVYAQLVLQSHLIELDELRSWNQDSETDEVSLNFDAIADAIQDELDTNSTNGKLLLAEYVRAGIAMGWAAHESFYNMLNSFATQSEELDTIIASTGKKIFALSGSSNLDLTSTINSEVPVAVTGGTGANVTVTGSNSDFVNGGDGNDTVTLNDGHDYGLGGTGNDTLSGGNGADILRGGDGNDTVSGGSDDDSLFGDAGTDTISGNGGKDRLQGGNGDDALDGGSDADVYLFNIADGIDSIQETNGSVDDTDTIQFAPGISAQDLIFIDESGNNDLVISVRGGSTHIRLKDQLDSTQAANHIEQIIFNDGSVLAKANWTITSGTHGTGSGETITGTSGADTIFAHGGNDTVNAGNNVDTVYGGAGNDTLNGEDGNDIVYGEDGDDSINGGASNDTVSGGKGNDSVIGGNGNDTYLFDNGDGQDTINENTTSNNTTDNLTFGGELTVADVTFSASGNDLIIAVNGTSDQVTIQGHLGTDTSKRMEDFNFSDGKTFSYSMLATGMGLNPTSGNNTLTGTSSAEYLYGLAGNDTVSAGSGADVVDGGTGNDTLNGQNGDDILYGGDGDDTINGNDNNDTIVGGKGNDTIVGGRDGDTYVFNLGDGQDSIEENTETQSVTDTFKFGAGIAQSDLAFYNDGSNNLVIEVVGTTDKITITGQLGTDTSKRIEDFVFADTSTLTYSQIQSALALSGTSGADTVTGTANNDVIYGLAGNDTLKGNSGDDTYRFNTGHGNDTINENLTAGEDGFDVIEFGAGINVADIMFSANSNDDLIVTNTVSGATVTVSGHFSPEVAKRVEQIKFADGTEIDYEDIPASLRTNGTSSANTLTGSLLSEIIDGKQGNDTLSGGSGRDTYLFNLGDGQDIIDENSVGDDSIDVVQMGSGIDAEDIVFEGSGTDDLIIKINGTSDQITIVDQFSGDVSKRVENVVLNDGTIIQTPDIYPILGTSSGNTLTGGSAAEHIKAGAGNDTITANAGNDVTDGEDGDDTINAGDGNDTVIGGAGSDTLTGGKGDDTYQFNLGDGSDTISENTQSEDSVDSISFGAGISKQSLIITKDASSTNDLIISVDGATDLIRVQGHFGTDVSKHVESLIFKDGTTFESDEFPTTAAYHGTTGGDTQSGTSSADVIYGHEGNDTITGAGGNDTISGGKGTDTLTGGLGDDTYVYNLGDGSETINENTDSTDTYDTIKFGSGITQQNVILSKDAANQNDLLISINGVTDIIRVQGHFGTDVSKRLEKLIFADGSELTYTSFPTTIAVHGTSGNDTLTGTSSADTIYAVDGNDTVNAAAGADTIFGGLGNDTLAGQGGNDTLSGGSGDDTYNFNVGDGADTINENDVRGEHSIDTIHFGTGIDPEDLVFSGSGNSDLVITVGTSGDKITVSGHFSGDLAKRIEKITFADHATEEIYDTDINSLLTVTGTSSADTIGPETSDTIKTSHVALGETINALAGNDTINAGAGADTVNAGDGDDTVSGKAGADMIFGGAGADNIDAGSGNDTIEGGTGNDTLTGSSGNDTYVFSSGDGTDTITEDTVEGRESNDTIKFGSSVTQSAVTFSASGNNLVIGYGTGNQITIIDQLASPVEPEHQVETIIFDDGAALDKAYFVSSAILGTAGNDSKTGTSGADTFVGFQGDDTLQDTSGGNDTLVGGTGVDLLKGGSGDDTYIYNRGDGSDTIDETSGTTDTIKFGPGIRPEELIIYRDANSSAPNDLIIAIGGATDIIRVKEHFGTDTGKKIDKLSFTSTETETFSDILSSSFPTYSAFCGTKDSDTLTGTSSADRYYTHEGNDAVLLGAGADVAYGGAGNDSLQGEADNDTLYGEAGNDSVFGDAGNDTLSGGTGIDSLVGGAGDDVYQLNLGDGSDTIDENITAAQGTDKIKFGTGIKVEDVVFYASESNDDDLVVEILRTGDKFTVKGHFGTDVSKRIENFEFADTTVLSHTDVAARLIIKGDSDVDEEGLVIVDDKWEGTSSADYINGLTGDDIITALAGNDNIFGDSGNDVIDAGDGNDVIVAGTDDDYVAGGAGNDTYIFNRGDGQDDIEETSGTDTIRFGPGILPTDLNFRPIGDEDLLIELVGTEDSIRVIGYLSGTSGMKIEQIIFDDSATVLDNDDIDNALEILASDYADFIVGSNYSTGETISAQLGNDIVYGLAGPDTLHGEEGNDYLDGGTGDDDIYGEEGNDKLFGGADDDTYFVNGNDDGQDTIDENGIGDDGDDTLSIANGKRTADISFSLSGTTDLLVTIAGTTDTVLIKGQYGEDIAKQVETILFDNASTLAIPTHITVTGTSGADTITGNAASENISAGDGNDTVNAGGGNDIVDGGLGNDTLNGGTGADTITAGAGTDTLNGGTGADSLQGGADNDTYNFNVGDGYETIEEGGGTTDKIHFGTGIAPEDIIFSGSGTEDLLITVGSTGDKILVKGQFGSDSSKRLELVDFQDDTDTFTDTQINSLLTTMGTVLSDDPLTGSDVSHGEDIFGLAGNDRILAGAGPDNITGGSGDDTYVFETGDGADLIDENTTADEDTFDTVEFASGIAQSAVSFANSSGDLVITYGTGDTVTVNDHFGTDIEKRLEQVKFSDDSLLADEYFVTSLMMGTSSANTITGNSSANTIVSFAGNDTVDGSSGNDTIVGGTGADSLTGGTGNDTFDYALGDGVDTISENGSPTDTDVISFGPGISQSSLIITKDANSLNDLIISVNGATDMIRVSGHFNGTNNRVETLAFDIDADLQYTSFSSVAALHGTTGVDTYGGDANANVYYGHEGNDSISGSGGADTLYGGAGNDTISGDAGNDVIYGGDGDDNLSGGADDDDIYGEGGNDYIDGQAGTDTDIWGGTGDDYMIGGDNTDRFHFNIGDGIDIIEENITGNSSSDSMIFHGAVYATDVVFARSGNDLIISNLYSTDVVTVKGHYDSNNNKRMEDFEFKDALTIDHNKLASAFAEGPTNANDTVNGTAGTDYLFALGGNDTMDGKAGDDMLAGGTGNDTIDGGGGTDLIAGHTGNDTLLGNSGNDTYLFAKGDGSDTVNDSGGTDEIVFRSSILQSEVAFYMNGSNLQVGYLGSSDLITVQNQTTSSTKVERLELSDGSYLTDADINSIISEMSTYATAHSISFTSLSDVKASADLMNIIATGWNAA